MGVSPGVVHHCCPCTEVYRCIANCIQVLKFGGTCCELHVAVSLNLDNLFFFQTFKIKVLDA